VPARGRIVPADRESFRRWLAAVQADSVDLAVAGCTGWRFVVEECQGAGVRAHLAEPDDVAGWKGGRQHAKTDRLDARHPRELLKMGKLPEGWIPPGHVLEIRAKVRPYKDLLGERSRWQRVHATLFHLGGPAQTGLLDFGPRPARPVGGAQPGDSAGDSGSAADDRQFDHELTALRAELVAFGRRQPGRRELQHESGISALTAVVIWSELGDARRFRNSRTRRRAASTDRASAHLPRGAPHRSSFVAERPRRSCTEISLGARGNGHGHCPVTTGG
jgi:hypothetical protein